MDSLSHPALLLVDGSMLPAWVMDSWSHKGVLTMLTPH